MRHFCRTQTKFVKVMFLHLPVSHSASKGSALGGLHPGGIGQTPPIGYYGIRSTSGRYASYWNAFLLKIKNHFLQLFSLNSICQSTLESHSPTGRSHLRLTTARMLMNTLQFQTVASNGMQSRPNMKPISSACIALC